MGKIILLLVTLFSIYWIVKMNTKEKELTVDQLIELVKKKIQSINNDSTLSAESAKKELEKQNQELSKLNKLKKQLKL